MEHPLRSYREKRGLSRAQLATMLGITEAMVGHVERGVRRVSAERAVEWERAHGLPAAIVRPDLFSEQSIAAE